MCSAQGARTKSSHLRCIRFSLILCLLVSGQLLNPVALAAETTDPDEQPEKKESTESDELPRFEFEGDVDQKSLGELSKKEARNRGFVFGTEKRRDNRSSATLVALTGGAILHGLGHWYRDDRESAWKLLAAEVASIALAGAGILVRPQGTDGAGPLVGDALLYAGGSFFALSYLIDLIGTYNGPDAELPASTERYRGLSVSAGYDYVDLEGLPRQAMQFFQAKSEIDIGAFYGRVRYNQDVLLGPWTYGGTVGIRPYRGRDLDDFAFIQADTQWLNLSLGASPYRLRGQLVGGYSLDIGRFFGHLRDLAIRMSGGYERHWYGEGQVTEAVDFGRSRGDFVFGTHLLFNVTDVVRLDAGLKRRVRTAFGGQGSRTSKVGVARLNYRVNELVDVDIRAEFGDAYKLGAVADVWLWR